MSTLRAEFSIWCALNQISWEMLHDICNKLLFFLNKLYDFDSKPLDIDIRIAGYLGIFGRLRRYKQYSVQS
jgi:hypothetical protein